MTQHEGCSQCKQASSKTLRAMLAGGEAGAAALALELNEVRGQLLDEEEVAGARFLAVLQVSRLTCQQSQRL